MKKNIYDDLHIYYCYILPDNQLKAVNLNIPELH